LDTVNDYWLNNILEYSYAGECPVRWLFKEFSKLDHAIDGLTAGHRLEVEKPNLIRILQIGVERVFLPSIFIVKELKLNEFCVFRRRTSRACLSM
jgi:hypothetical protein